MTEIGYNEFKKLQEKVDNLTKKMEKEVNLKQADILKFGKIEDPSYYKIVKERKIFNVNSLYDFNFLINFIYIISIIILIYIIWFLFTDYNKNNY